MSRINLTAADLAANKQGHLSERQGDLLRKQRWVWLAGTIGLVAIGVALTAVLWLRWRDPSFPGRGVLFIIVPVALFWLWLLRRCPQQWRRTNQDLQAGRVVYAEGPLQTGLDFGPGLLRVPHHHIQVNDHSFRVPQALHRQFVPGTIYRIYYAPRCKQFLGGLPLVQEPDADAAPHTLIEPLTTREREVLQLIAAGLTNQEIADQLSLSVNTIKMYASQLYRKLGVNRRTEAVARARTLNLL